MKARGLKILVVEDDAGLAATFAELLQHRSHEVTVARSGEEALGLARHDVLVADVGLGGISGLDLIEELILRGEPPRAVVVSGQPSAGTIERAVSLGVVDFLTKPFEPEELYRAVEAGHPGLPRGGSSHFKRSYPASPEACVHGPRHLAAYALRCGVGPAARARIASATAEAVENCWRHASLTDENMIAIEAELSARELVVSVRDQGSGFETTIVGRDRPGDPRSGGIARMSALADDFRVVSVPGRGTTIVMTFAIYRTCFDSDGAFDLSELDWLSPATARMVLSAVENPSLGDAFKLSPALASVVGRLLAHDGREAE